MSSELRPSTHGVFALEQKMMVCRQVRENSNTRKTKLQRYQTPSRRKSRSEVHFRIHALSRFGIAWSRVIVKAVLQIRAGVLYYTTCILFSLHSLTYSLFYILLWTVNTSNNYFVECLFFFFFIYIYLSLTLSIKLYRYSKWESDFELANSLHAQTEKNKRKRGKRKCWLYLRRIKSNPKKSSCYLYFGYLVIFRQLKPVSHLEVSIVRGNHT